MTRPPEFPPDYVPLAFKAHCKNKECRKPMIYTGFCWQCSMGTERKVVRPEERVLV